MIRTVLFALCLFQASPVFAQQPSICFGTPADGSLAHGWKLPHAGENFGAYSTLAWIAGRTYVHSAVHGVVISAYHDLQRTAPEKTFLYGETGFARGGLFRPHKTHRNGLSVDFMVPVIDAEGRSVPLPTSLLNKLGYDLEFDNNGALGDLRIDFDAMASHLRALDAAAKREGISVSRVIFDPELQPLLRNASAWRGLDHLRFSTRRSWVRHDEHYHVDFAADCEPLPR